MSQAMDRNTDIDGESTNITLPPYQSYYDDKKLNRSVYCACLLLLTQLMGLFSIRFLSLSGDEWFYSKFEIDGSHDQIYVERVIITMRSTSFDYQEINNYVMLNQTLADINYSDFLKHSDPDDRSWRTSLKRDVSEMGLVCFHSFIVC